MAPNRSTRFFCFGLLVAGDMVLFNIAFLLAYGALKLWGYSVSVETYLEIAWHTWVFPLGVLLPALAFYFAGMYRSADDYVFVKGAEALFTGVAAAVVALLGAIWFFRGRLQALAHLEEEADAAGEAAELVWGFPTRAILIVLVLAPLILWAWRMLANGLERRLLGWSARPRRTLIVGGMPRADLQRLMTNYRPPYRVSGCLGGEPTNDDLAPYLGPFAKLRDVLQSESIEEVFIMAPDLGREEQLEALTLCYENGARPHLVLGIYEALLSATQGRLQGGVPLRYFRTAGISGWPLVVKRLIDAILAAVAVVASLVVVIPACVAIILESKGWPIFSQPRVGQHGRLFRLYKLRTMIIDADVKGGPLTTNSDPRITRVGQFLRRTSVDELPQLWNVLKGDMSLVGPRAVVPYVANQFQDWEMPTLSVRPGVTGLAQISGRDEIGFREKSLLNLYYIRNHSIWLDLRILFDTVGVVLSMEGTGGTRGAQKPAIKQAREGQDR